MSVYTLEITLESDTAFSMGAGVSGTVDSEIQHGQNGLPLISGRTIKGLLVNECSEILYALGEPDKKWVQAAQNLFGSRGDMEYQSNFSIGDATLAPDLVFHLQEDKFSHQAALDALTDIRYQTAMSEYGAPKDESLRAIRTLISGVTFYAPFNLPETASDSQALFAACVYSLRRAGLGRNRGKGRIKVRISNRPLDPHAFSTTESADLTGAWFKNFKKEVAG